MLPKSLLRSTIYFITFVAVMQIMKNNKMHDLEKIPVMLFCISPFLHELMCVKNHAICLLFFCACLQSHANSSFSIAHDFNVVQKSCGLRKVANRMISTKKHVMQFRTCIQTPPNTALCPAMHTRKSFAFPRLTAFAVYRNRFPLPRHARSKSRGDSHSVRRSATKSQISALLVSLDGVRRINKQKKCDY